MYCAMLCCVCFVLFYRTILCYVVLSCVVLVAINCVVLCCVALCFVLFCFIVLYCIVLCCVVIKLSHRFVSYFTCSCSRPRRSV